MIARARHALGMALLCASLFSFSSAWAQENVESIAAKNESFGEIVSGVRVEGTSRIEAGVVRNALRTKVGAPLDVGMLSKDLERIWDLGYFSDAQLYLDESVPGQPVVVVVVQERPAIRKIEIVGNKELSNDDLKDQIDIKPYAILNLSAARRNARKLQEKYLEKGYYLAEVEQRVEYVGDNEVDLFFDIDENAKIQVARITFTGNVKLSDKKLREVMQTREGDFFSFLTGAGSYREEAIQRDVQALLGLYYDNGFVHARVAQPRVSISGDKRLLFISIAVTEGEQYRIGQILFAGDLLFTDEQLREKTIVETGELFSRTRLQHDMAAISEKYFDEGYAFANVNPQTLLDDERRIVDLTYEVEKGEQVTIERIELVGNVKTRDKVIRREMRVYEGELFSGSGIRLSRQRITALGFFETVEVNFKRGSRDDTVIVTATVKEKPTGTLQAGMGFSSIENFMFMAQVSQNNLFGWGQTASFAAQLSSLRQLLQLSFTDPYLFDSKWIFSFSLFLQELDYFGFIRASEGGDITFGYHLTEDLMAHLGYGIEDISVRPGSSGFGNPDSLPESRFRDGLVSALRLTLNFDQRDNRLFPTAGNYQSLSGEFSRPWLGASFVFNRYLFNSRYYQPLPLGLVLKGQATLGYIEGNNLPISELFFIGGINTVRGYGLRSIAPTVPVALERDPGSSLVDFAVGGNKEAIFNFELEFPIIEAAMIRGVLFYDMGNVYAEDRGFFDDSEGKLGMLHSWGFGIRWFSPIGPLRLEVGFPVTPRRQDQGHLFEFTIGNFF